MAKTIIVKKILISLDDAGNVTDALLQYKLSNDGAIAQNLSSVAVLPALDATALEDMVAAALESAKTSEGI